MSALRARDARAAAGANAQADNEPEDPAVVSPRPSERPPPALPSETTVLHIGDSFAGALGLPLGRRLKGAGSKSVLHFKTASFIPNWAHSKELRLWLLRYQPDLVLITLGANEIEIVEPEQRAKPVRRLVQALEGRPCVWVGPPLWTDDTRLMDVIRDNVSPCRFLDSTRLVPDLERMSDGIHPTLEARERWADAVVDWLRRERLPNAARPWDFRPAASP